MPETNCENRGKINLVRNIMDDEGYNEDMGAFEEFSETQLLRFYDLFISWANRVDEEFTNRYLMPRLTLRNIYTKYLQNDSDRDISGLMYSAFLNLYSNYYSLDDENDDKMHDLIRKFSSIKINIDYVRHSKGVLIDGYISMPYNELIKYNADVSLSLSETFYGITIDKNMTIGELFDIFTKDTSKIPYLNMSSYNISRLYDSIFSKIFHLPDTLYAGFALFGCVTTQQQEYFERHGACTKWAKILSAIGPDRTMMLYRVLFDDTDSERVNIYRNISKKSFPIHKEK